jgi:serine O-acetyltransferase
MPKLSGLIQQLRKDYRKHEASLQNPALWAVAVYRFGVWSAELDGIPGVVASKVYGALQMGVQLTTGIVFNREAKVGEDFHLIHWGNTKIHPGVVMGDRCGIMHDVTLGTNMERDGAPRLGDDVFVGAGAKILGPIRIGNGARIAANSLVLSDVPDGATAVGVPARVMTYSPRIGAGGGTAPSPAGPKGPAQGSSGSSASGSGRA